MDSTSKDIDNAQNCMTSWENRKHYRKIALQSLKRVFWFSLIFRLVLGGLQLPERQNYIYYIILELVNTLEKGLSLKEYVSNLFGEIYLFFVFIISSVFIYQISVIGMNRFILNALEKKEKTVDIIFGFKFNYLGNVRTCILYMVIITLGFLFGIIPGIYFCYCYKMVYFIRAQKPSLSARETLSRSRKMMKGYKRKLFLVDVSFLGFYLIGKITFRLSEILFSDSYYDLIVVQYYLDAEQKYNEKMKRNRN